MGSNQQVVGKVIHYYGKLGVGIVELSGSLKTGDQVQIKGHTTDISQTVEQMQIDKKDVESAKKGDVIGLKVDDKVREADVVTLA